MTRKRSADFDLRVALADPGFTPRAGDAPAVLELFAEGGDLSAAAERALLSLGPVAREVAVSRLGARVPRAETGTEPDLARVVRLLGRFPADESTTRALATALTSDDGRVRRAAASALAKLEAHDVEEDLLRALDKEDNASARRAIVTSLGRVGGERARVALEADESRAGTSRELGRAQVMLDRGKAREAESGLDLSLAPAASIVVALRCRQGLEDPLIDELGASLHAAVPRTPGLLGPRVEVTLTEAPARLFASRLWTSFGVPLPPVMLAAGASPVDDGLVDAPLVDAIARSLTAPDTIALLRLWTRGPIRFRLSFARGGKRRAVVWGVAEEVRKRAPDLVNDPIASPWEARIHEARGAVQIELVPHGVDDRFAYRQGDVPAASHPTIAAALVRASEPRPDDVVWDPFVGSGTELCERAIAGPYARLIGMDLDASALEIARKNLEASGASRFELFAADATRFIPPGLAPTRIITNPPLGRRVQRSASLGPLLDRFLMHAARCLAPGGRIAWISPFADRTRSVAAEVGLSLVSGTDVDLGGFTGELQVFGKRKRP